MKLKIEKTHEFFNTLNTGLDNLKREDLLTDEALETKIFTKDSKVSFKIVVLFLFSLATNGQTKSAASTLAELWSKLGVRASLPTMEAVAKKLNVISIEKFKNNILNLFIYNQCLYNVKYFCDKRVYIVDGSKVTLPRNDYTLDKYGCQTGGDVEVHYPQMHILTLLELGSNVIKSFALGARKACEKSLLLEAIKGIVKGSVIVGDCGFHSAGLFWLLGVNELSFVIRINEVNAFKMINNLNFENNETSTLMEITKEMRENYPGLKDAPKYIKVRILKIKEVINGHAGRSVYLVTQMFEPKIEQFAELYYERQRIEDSFKVLKIYGGLEKIHPNSCEQKIELAIIGVIGYHNMMQLSLARLAKTPSPNENKEITMNRKVSWENMMHFFLSFNRTGQVEKTYLSLLERTKNIIRVGRFALRCSLRPLNSHQRSDVRKKAKINYNNRLEQILKNGATQSA